MTKIAILPGDGIGPEIMEQALKVLDKVAQKFGYTYEYESGLIGGAAWEPHGTHFPEATKILVDNCDAVLFGSVGGPVADQLKPQWKDCERNSILAIRAYLSLTTNIRLAPVYTSLLELCPLKPEIIGSDPFEIMIIRELSEGIYFGKHDRPNPDKATDEAFHTRSTLEKLAIFSFEAAKKRKQKLVSVDKANVLETSRLWREVFEAEAARHPDIEFESMYVDNMVAQLVKNPKAYDLLVCPNLFGDIVSDLTAVFPGSLGMLPSASLGRVHLYEPSGGSAPDIAGKDWANPIAQILSAALMLRYSFNQHEGADAIEQAVQKVLESGKRTGDILGSLDDSHRVGCAEMGDLIAQNI